MLNQGNSDILKDENKETLKGYPSIKLSQFWTRHQDKIKSILFEKDKDNLYYEPARKTILTYYNVKSYEGLIVKQDENKKKLELDLNTKIKIFIEMLNQGNSNILKQRNKETLEGYPNIKLSYFWTRHQERIKQKLFIELKDNKEYAKARCIRR